jgi:hypothetical protein
MRPKVKRLIFIAPAAIVGVLVFLLIGGELVKLLWNWLTPALFGWKEITFWQALALLALCRILFGRSGLGRGMRRSGTWRRTPGGWERMTPEEREKCRQWFYGRWGSAVPPDSTPNT